MMSIASGLASVGFQVFAYSIVNFATFRALEQIRNDIAYHNYPVCVVAVGAGTSYGTLGYSHHGLEDVAVTTNGQLLPRKAQLIADTGLRRINVSLDTLNADHFRDIARSGDLATVLRGIDLMLEAGLKVKVNMVPMRHKNDDQILPLLDYCLQRGIELRFIELMSMGHLQGNALFEVQFFGMQEILDLIATRYEFARTEAPFDSTAARFEIPGSGAFGIIANESEPFCRTCTRLRLSSNGKLYGCLSSAKSHDMTQVLELPDALAMVRLQKMLSSALADKQLANFSGEVTVMKFIGG